MRKYLLDTNVFIQASNMHYGIDFCPAFWEWLIRQNSSLRVYSITAVADEIAIGDDGLSVWATDRGEGFFLPHDQLMVDSLQLVSEWVVSQQYFSHAVSEFFRVADSYLIAYAHAHQFTLVTHEIRSDKKNRIKIPNVCDGLSVEVVSPFTMLRQEQARFCLETLL